MIQVKILDRLEDCPKYTKTIRKYQKLQSHINKMMTKESQCLEAADLKLLDQISI